MNGRSAPFVISQDSTGTLTLTSDVYTLNSDGTFTEQEAGTFTPTIGAPSPESYSDSGRWTLNGTSVVITYTSDGTSETGAFTGGNTITFTAGTDTAIYQK